MKLFKKRPERELVTCLGCLQQVFKEYAREVGVNKFFHNDKKCYELYIVNSKPIKEL